MATPTSRLHDISAGYTPSGTWSTGAADIETDESEGEVFTSDDESGMDDDDGYKIRVDPTQYFSPGDPVPGVVGTISPGVAGFRHPFPDGSPMHHVSGTYRQGHTCINTYPHTCEFAIVHKKPSMATVVRLSEHDKHPEVPDEYLLPVETYETLEVVNNTNKDRTLVRNVHGEENYVPKRWLTIHRRDYKDVRIYNPKNMDEMRRVYSILASYANDPNSGLRAAEYETSPKSNVFYKGPRDNPARPSIQAGAVNRPVDERRVRAWMNSGWGPGAGKENVRNYAAFKVNCNIDGDGTLVYPDGIGDMMYNFLPPMYKDSKVLWILFAVDTILNFDFSE